MNRDKGNEKHSSISINDFTDAVAEVLYKKGYKEIVTFDEIVQYALVRKKSNSRIKAFVVSVKKNYDPQNGNDKLIIVQGLLDEDNKPISLDGKESESRIIHTRTIDKNFIDVLNGAESKIVRLY
ncbi:MAG: hypothetical protein NC321_02555 [Clostridium sp.]|nr:hypothetical protein [Clostridium sp.]